MTVVLSASDARALARELRAMRALDRVPAGEDPRTLAKDPRYASRGIHLEKTVMSVNALYRQLGIALVEKVPTEWLPIRDRTGRIVSAKVSRLAPVDFVGVYRGRGIAFDAKSTKEARMRWDRIEDHQAGWLADWTRAGGLGFVLVGTVVDGREAWWLYPWDWWRRGMDSWREKAGPASFKVGGLPAEWRVPDKGRVTMDYLSVVDRTRGEEANHGQA